MLLFGAKYLYLIIIAMAVIFYGLQPRERRKNILVLSIIYLPLAYLFGQIAAHFYFDARPFVVGHFQPLIPHAANNGFPSDHMLFSSAIASIVFIYNKKIGVLAWVIAHFVGYSRVSSGLHHWIDVFGSALVAIAVMVLVDRYIVPYIAKMKTLQRFFNYKSV